MDFQQFIQNTPYCFHIDEGAAILEINDYSRINTETCMGFHTILYIERGSLTLDIDRHKYTMSSYSYADIMGTREFHFIEATPDIHAFIIILTESYMADLMKDKPPFPLSYIIGNETKPIRELTMQQGELLNVRFKSICQQFTDIKHYFKVDMIKCTIWMLLMDIANFYLSKVGNTDTIIGDGRKHELFMKFMDLVSLHAKNEHSVVFYASALCVTPQYLARIVKELSGHTVLQWIQKTVLGEVNKLLKDTKLSIQQISDDFCFPDQATFSKFYKRSMGMPPSEYRTRNLI